MKGIRYFSELTLCSKDKDWNSIFTPSADDYFQKDSSCLLQKIFLTFDKGETLLGDEICPLDKVTLSYQTSDSF